MSKTAAPSQTSPSVLKRLLVGRPLSSGHLEHTLLPKILALPVFSSDALSSVAYATEEILAVLLAASVSATHFVMPIALAIATLMVIVVSSYRQTVRAYPSGGGAYIVSKDNLGVLPGLVAAAALLTDYVLTVSVSVVAGVFAIVSAVPSLSQHRVILSLAFVAFITLVNLRGVRESGTLFAVPVYAFVASIYVMVVAGLAQCLFTHCPRAYTSGLPPNHDLAAAAGSVGLFVILHAFSSGSTALTGVEAISNGVPAFRRPQAKNAAETLTIMGAIAVTMFLGISFLASRAHPTVSPERSVVAQIAHGVFGGGVGFYIVQVFTAAILILAANTSYQDFPRLASILARDRFLPRQFSNRGDRLVFSNGVLVLAGLAALLIYIFDADLSRLIQLYVVGVFTSFTLSQTGMVRHWLKEKHKGVSAQPGWRRAIVINGIGAVATAVVLVVITATKFTHGAWIVIVAMPLIVLMFLGIHRHYESVKRQLRMGQVVPGEVGTNFVVLLVRNLDVATAEALGYVRSFRPQWVRAVYPSASGVPEDVQRRWRELARGGPDLEVLPMHGHDLLEAVRRYTKAIRRGNDDFVTVVVPEVVDEGLPLYLLRSRAAIRLKSGLLREQNVVVTDVPVLKEGATLVGVDGRPLIPERTVVRVFVSGVHDASIRAVNYAMTLESADTRAVYFDLDPDIAYTMQEEWADRGMPIPLDIVEAPFRDLTGPMLQEVRRITAREDTIASIVIPEIVVRHSRHMVLHNQSALFVKRLMLYEPRTILSSVPYSLD
ncbi:MAG: APC family permease [Actinomycetota bacterium]